MSHKLEIKGISDNVIPKKSTSGMTSSRVTDASGTFDINVDDTAGDLKIGDISNVGNGVGVEIVTNYIEIGQPFSNGIRLYIDPSTNSIGVIKGKFQIDNASAAAIAGWGTVFDGELIYPTSTDATFLETGLHVREAGSWGKIVSNWKTTEDLADAAAASLTTRTSQISTGATGETNTLAAGHEGQIKVFVMEADGGGDRVITVTNAAWGTTMTFGDVGDGCTLQYIDAKWYCIGNNGVVFA